MNKRKLIGLTATTVLFISVFFLVDCGYRPPFDEGHVPFVREVAQESSASASVRGERGPLLLHRDGDAYECSICHDGFEGTMGEDALQGEHADIFFDHALSLQCLNCHNPKNADAYVYHDGSEIPGDQPTQLCAKCHGLHYEEWELAVHGRVNGTWDPAYGEQAKLDCIQCHDPHSPKFPKMRPEKPPVATRFEIGKE